MNKAQHKKKLHQARKMLTAQERKEHCPPFGSKAWGNRVEARKQKQANQGKGIKIKLK